MRSVVGGGGEEAVVEDLAEQARSFSEAAWAVGGAVAVVGEEDLAEADLVAAGEGSEVLAEVVLAEVAPASVGRTP